MKKGLYIINTIKHMNPRQVVYRTKYEMLKRTKKNIKKISAERVNKDIIFYKFFLAGAEEKLNIYYLAELDKADDLIKNTFEFINGLKYKFQEEIDWRKDPFNYRLWTFKLNYFDYLEDLIEGYFISYNQKYLLKGLDLIEDWINANLDRYDSDIWDPYVVSKRVSNWINFVTCFRAVMKNPEKEIINDAIALQAAFISKNIEYYLDCNHILMDAKALVFCGVYLENEELITQGLDLLNKEYSRQVFEDGSHYERSPSYQVEVLEDYLQCYILLSKNGRKEEGEKVNLKEKCEKLCEFLFAIMDANGKIPLLNDSSLDYPFEAQDILQCCAILFNKSHYKIKCQKELSKYCHKIFGIEGIELYEKLGFEELKIKNKIVVSDTGYIIIDDKANGNNIRIIFDGGDGGPDYNLGHAHADSLSVLFTYNKDNVLCDAGTYTYKRCDERNQFRSTHYHNTIEIDGLSSSQVWGAFRVAKRAKSKVLKVEDENDYTLIRAIHDGYTKVLKKDKIFHERNLVYIKEKAIIIIDKLYGKITSSHKVKINFNIPLKVKKISKKSIEINNSIKMFCSYDTEIKEGYISEYFNEKRLISKLQGELKLNTNKILVTVINFSIEDINYEITDDKISILVSDKKLLEIK